MSRFIDPARETADHHPAPLHHEPSQPPGSRLSFRARFTRSNNGDTRPTMDQSWVTRDIEGRWREASFDLIQQSQHRFNGLRSGQQLLPGASPT